MSNKVYPNLINSDEYRMSELNHIRDKLEKDCGSRKSQVKKYKLANKAIEGVMGTFSAIAVVCSVGGTVSATTGVGIIATLPLGILAASSGALTFILEMPRKRLRNKLAKHEQKVAALTSKKTTILNRVSKFIEDGKIDHDEYSIIMNDVSDLDKQLAQIDKTFVQPTAPPTELDDGLRQRIMSLLNIKKE